MERYYFTNEHTGVKYVRVSKRTAFKAFCDHKTLCVYGKMERPNWIGVSPSFWSNVEDEDSIIGISYKDWCKYTFERLIRNYEFYNHKNPWYYLPVNIAEKYTNIK